MKSEHDITSKESTVTLWEAFQTDILEVVPAAPVAAVIQLLAFV